MLPGTGGLTRVVDKRHVRRDLADYFSTRSEGVGGKKAVQWRLVDEAVPRAKWDEIGRRAGRRAGRALQPARRTRRGVELTPLAKTAHRRRDLLPLRDGPAGPRAGPSPRSPSAGRGRGRARRTSPAVHAQGDGFWPLALTRELDDLILDLRTNELELGTWVLRTSGDPARVLGYDRLLLDHRDDWLANEIVQYLKRTLKRLDVTSRSLIALIEPGSCFAGSLLELALAADRSFHAVRGVRGDRLRTPTRRRSRSAR